MKDIRIGGKKIGVSEPVFVIAEAGVNHNGKLKLAKKLIDAAKNAGADAIKFQTFTVGELVTENAAQADYQVRNTGVSGSQAEMLRRLTLSKKSFRTLKSYAEKKDIAFLSTPFSTPDADFLASMDVPAFKIASGDLTNLPLLAHVAKFKKPILLSTGMATMGEIRDALEELKKNGASETILLQCTSEYPAPLSHANLRAMETLRKEFGTVVGFSDHTEGIKASVYAAALGACVIEKHLTLDRELPGPDHRASLEPEEFHAMVKGIRSKAHVEAPEELLGTGKKIPFPEELAIARHARKSIAARIDIAAGDMLSEANLRIVRPESHLPPKALPELIGRKARHPIPRGTALMRDMVE